ncbi:hypothetical protein [Nostoc sp. LPT]|uniref:hypothetical protein n=1 Tax=Nostoc sp. LPT TaxID=2815387 RepID=UPI001D54DFAE|nr:hypothetical protein [Nostoc sp. LPT]MBN4006479.1 hypothetical protein [Nostoc sp. LPT]
MMRKRDKHGQFTQKSNEPREVRSLRLTDSTWNKMGEIAEAREVTRADIIEIMFERNILVKGFSKEEIQSFAKEILDDDKVTRNEKDKIIIKRGLETLLNMLPD